MNATEKAMFWVRVNWFRQGCRLVALGLSDDAE